MRVTEVRIKLLPQGGSGRERLRAFCTVTLDDEFVVRDLKIIEGGRGAFVAMPSRRLTDRCSRCGSKNHLRARYCNDCAAPVDRQSAGESLEERPRLYVDVAHPINARCRSKIHDSVIEAFNREVERSRADGYVFASIDDVDVDESFGEAEAGEAGGGFGTGIS